MGRTKISTSDPINEAVGVTSPKPSPRIRVPHSHSLASDLIGKSLDTTTKSYYPTRKRSPTPGHGLLSFKGGVSSRGYFCWIQAVIIIVILCCQIPLLIRYLNLSPNNRIGRGRFAYATLLCQDDMADASGVLIHSLLKTGTPYDVIVLAANVSADKSAMLRALGATIEPILSPVSYPSPIEEPCCYSKLLLWNLTRYDRIVYLDSDMLVVAPIDNLFSRPPLAAVPDSMPPDRFNSGLLVLEPKASTFADMMSRANTTASPNVGDQGFLNEYFSNWYTLPSDHHLPYGYNTLARMTSAVTRRARVEPSLRVIHFSGPGKPWNLRRDSGQPTGRRYDKLWWHAHEEMEDSLDAKGVPGRKTNPSCRHDYSDFSRGVGEGGGAERRLSVVMRVTDDRVELVEFLVTKYAAMRVVQAVFVIWVGKESDLSFKSISGKLVEVIPAAQGGGNASWTMASAADVLMPIKALPTECVFVCDQTLEVSEEVLQTVFRRWRETPFRVMGFTPRAHYYRGGNRGRKGGLEWVRSPRVEYSMVLSKAVVMSAEYLRAFTCHLPRAALETLHHHPECTDAAFNFMAAHLSGLPPLLVLDSFRRDLDTGQLSTLHSGLDKNGSLCLNFLELSWGYNPLKNTSEALALYRPTDKARMGFTRGGGGGGSGVVGGEEEVKWHPVFDFEGVISRQQDENLKFMPLLNITLHLPEIALIPSSSSSSPHSVLCIRGNSSDSGPDSLNEYSLLHPSQIPRTALRLPSTSFILLSRHGFEDHLLPLLDLLANLNQYSTEHIGFIAQYAVFYKSAGLVPSLSPTSLALLQALLGSQIRPLQMPDSATPVCFERAVVVRRNRGLLSDRPLLLDDMRKRVWQFCAGGRPLSSLRLTILEDGRVGGKGRIVNGQELGNHLKDGCGKLCRPYPMAFSTTTDFCHQVRAVRTASVVIGAHGEAMASVLFYMTPGSLLLELAAPLHPPADADAPSDRQLAPIEFKEYVIQATARALGLRFRSLVMPQPANRGPSGMGGFVIKADGEWVAAEALAFVKECARRGVPPGKGGIPLGVKIDLPVIIPKSIEVAGGGRVGMGRTEEGADGAGGDNRVGLGADKVAASVRGRASESTNGSAIGKREGKGRLGKKVKVMSRRGRGGKGKRNGGGRMRAKKVLPL